MLIREIENVPTSEYYNWMPLQLFPHTALEQPPENAKLWRYMDIPKYLHMLTTKTLWFARADQLGDPFEGSTTRNTMEEWVEYLRENISPESVQNLLDSRSSDSISIVKHTYINSWHLSETESAAMWRLYKSDYGISVTTTLQRMKDAFPSEHRIFMSKIKYVDYEIAVIPGGNSFWPFVHKRQSFEHEKEVRLIMSHGYGSDLIFQNVTSPSFPHPPTPVGVSVPIDMQKLIIEVRIDPSAPKWFFETILNLTQKMGYQFNVVQSSLGKDPIH